VGAPYMQKKLRIWDSKFLADTYSIVAQMQAQLDSILENSDVQHFSDLPDSMIPSQTLYEISLCFELMYLKLLEYDLLNTGNKKHTTSLH
jgi:hypothetical protein